jgi:hypothetical protein
MEKMFRIPELRLRIGQCLEPSDWQTFSRSIRRFAVTNKFWLRENCFMRIDKFAFLISGQLLICSSVLSASSSAVPDAPLVVDQNSHIIVMEYEAWFGPNAVTFQGTAALPLLQSADMQRVGGGYDSADAAVIQ